MSNQRRSSVEDVHSTIQRIRHGETNLFVDLVRPHEHSLRLVTYSLLRNSADAEDVVQETKLKALAHLDQLRESDSFRSWLLRIAINEARMYLRKDRAYQRDAADPEGAGKEAAEFVPREFSRWHADPLHAVERKELWAAVAQALHSLDPIYREVFALRDMRHLSVSEAAQVLGLSEAAVHTRLHRARLLMREELAPLFRYPERAWVPMRKMMDFMYPLMRKAMGCDKVVPLLSKYIDGELGPADRARIERHLRRCGRCSIVVDTTRKLLYIVGDDRIFIPPFAYK